MEDYKERFSGFLKTKGLKLTPQRGVILDCIFNTHEHFHVEALLSEIQKIDQEVSRATLYRTIPLLLESGLIKKSEAVRESVNEKEYYEHVYGHPKHFHLICTKCGRIIEVDEQQNLKRMVKKIAESHEMTMSDYQISIKGICNECQPEK